MPSDFEIRVDTLAARDLKRLSKTHHPALVRIRKAVDSLQKNPFQGKPLKGSKEGCRSLREGDFRIIYEIYRESGIVLLIRVGDRKEVYR